MDKFSPSLNPESMDEYEFKETFIFSLVFSLTLSSFSLTSFPLHELKIKIRESEINKIFNIFFISLFYLLGPFRGLVGQNTLSLNLQVYLRQSLIPLHFFLQVSGLKINLWSHLL